MMSPAISPRPDQIAELTRGLDLPLAAIDEIYLRIISNGMAQAFKDIRAIAPTTVVSGDEAEVTALLEARLNRMIDENRVWRQLVASVVRGKESLNFDGTRLEKRPDLSIHFTSRTLRFPLVVAAKIIATKKGEMLYYSQGVRRFINGDYSWGSREAFIIAYVRDGTTISSRLKPYLTQPAQVSGYAVEDVPAAFAGSVCDAARSRHGRSFLYAHTTPPANNPGSIVLWHLWVDASAAHIS